MKLTKETLKQIIKEELEAVMNLEEEAAFFNNFGNPQIGGKKRKPSPKLSKEDDLITNILHDLLLTDGEKSKKELELLRKLLAHIKEENYGPSYDRYIEKVKDELPMLYRYELRDGFVVEGLVNLYKNVIKLPEQYYEKQKGNISKFAAGDQMHKAAKEKFGSGSAAGGERSFMQKAGSFLKGKGFREE